MMELFDISWPISEAMTTYKDQFPVIINQLKDFDKDNVRQSSLVINSHTGTHVDAPTHFLKEGKTVDQLLLDSFIGECIVIDCSDVVEKITVLDLEKHAQYFKKGLFLLIKTRNSERQPIESFDHNFIYIDKDAARYLVGKKFKGIGFDYLGIERDQALHETHVVFMENSITIIEGLRLKNIDPGCYELICLPLFVVGSEGAPARALLRR